MASAKNKLFFHILLVVVVACLVQGQEVAEDEQETEKDVKFTNGKISICQGEDRCEEVKGGDSTEVDKTYGRLFKSADTIREEEDTSTPIAGDSCKKRSPFRITKGCSTPKRCPVCTWDNGDRCCATCHYYRPVPKVITTWDGKPCITFNLQGRYQYIRYGSCRDPGAFCDKPYCLRNQWFVNRCQQQDSWQHVLCVKYVVRRGWFFSLEPFRYPSHCACNQKNHLK